MSTREDTVSDIPERERRLDEAFEAILDARERGELFRIPQIVAGYPDLRAELQDLLQVEADVLGLPGCAIDPFEILEGFKILSDYEVIEEIGRGGWGAVVRARHRFLGRDVAIKLLKDDPAAHASSLTRFLAEAQLASQLQHPNIAPVHEVGRMPDGRPAFVMEYVQGTTLSDLLQTRTSPADDQGRFLDYFLQVCRAVAYAHTTKGVLHRDLKPRNVMVLPGGEVQVMDWGLGKVVREREAVVAEAPAHTLRDEDRQHATLAGISLGTPSYMPPEQAKAQPDRIGPPSDVFGLGAILCEILTGLPPYIGGTRNEVQALAESGTVSPAHDRLRACGADPDLVSLAIRCLAPEPRDRPDHAGEVTSAVASYLNGLQEKLHKKELARARMRTRMVLAVAVVILASGAALAGMWYKFDRDARAEQAAFREKEVTKDFEEYDGHVRAEQWDEADKILRRVEGRLGEGGSEELRSRRDAARRDLDFVARFEDVRGRLIALIDEGRFDENDAVLGYARLFREYGLPLHVPRAAAAQIEHSTIRTQLLSALDHWFLIEPRVAGMTATPEVGEIALLAGNTPWRRQFHDPHARSNPGQLARLVKAAPLDELTAVEYETLAVALMSAKADSEWLLRRGQKRFLRDFWLNFLLAQAIALQERNHPPSLERRLRCEDAVAFARTALGLRPESTQVHAFLGRVLTDCERFDEAEAELRLVLQKDRKLVFVTFALAEARLRRGDLDGAESACREGLELAPGDVTGREQLGRILLQKGLPREAEEEFRKASESNRAAWTLRYGLAISLLHQGRLSEAKKAAQEAVRAAPSKGEAERLLARIEAMIRLEREEWSAITRGSYQPATGDERLLAAELCLLKRMPAEALRYFERAFAEMTPEALAWEPFFPLPPRSEAARAAVLAAAESDPAARLHKALGWLQEDLKMFQMRFAEDRFAAGPSLRRALGTWRHHADLAPLRSPSARPDLSAADRQEMKDFWEQVRRLLRT